ncbi:LysR family transcriptional regulator [Larsenimonas suaedae]|uniref:LysR family transcriptional regulator n=1 Tax=Larsenimonas suaedae TaxID=1851019 RepID=A0ABU1H017_9GAMM|nr:LysR family transcriptional regulator [Larsenimonas suaedae]MCM2972794.1 LysR family transcriptional regulator [Larsenimonas suaedae]MDR5896893.1 LysR family transcriptional regulator [Larsenimonas suaedae]
MNLNHLKLFLAVAEQESILAASRVLGIPNSTLARQLKAFERQLGQQLILRSTRHLRLTAEGRALAERARPLIEELEDLGDDVKSHQGTLSGTLTVAIPSEFGVTWLNGCIAQFTKAHPSLELECITSMAPLDPVRRDVHVSIAYHRGDKADSTQVIRPLLTMKSSVVIAPSLLGDRSPPATIKALAGEPCISTLTALKANPWVFLDDRGQAVTLRTTSRYRVDSSQMLISGALAGIGYAIIPTAFCEPYLATGELIELTLDHTPAPLEIVAIYPDRNGISTRTRAFVDLIEAELKRSVGALEVPS